MVGGTFESTASVVKEKLLAPAVSVGFTVTW